MATPPLSHSRLLQNTFTSTWFNHFLESRRLPPQPRTPIDKHGSGPKGRLHSHGKAAVLHKIQVKFDLESKNAKWKSHTPWNVSPPTPTYSSNFPKR